MMDYTELLPPDEVASLAAGLEVLDPHDKVWREFAALAIAAAAHAIRKAERDRCAQECENLADSYTPDEGAYVADHCALAIRDLKDV